MRTALVLLALALCAGGAWAGTTLVEGYEGISGTPPYTNLFFFGPRYADAAVATAAGEYSAGAQGLRIDLLNSGWGCIHRRALTGGETNWTGELKFGIYARANAAVGTTIEIGIEEADGEDWRSTATAATLTTSMAQYIWNLNTADLSNADSGSIGTTPGVIDLSNVAFFDVILRANSAATYVNLDQLQHGDNSMPAELSTFSAD